jgi:hypothetical protein
MESQISKLEDLIGVGGTYDWLALGHMLVE